MGTNLREVEDYLDQKFTESFDLKEAGATLAQMTANNQILFLLESLLDSEELLEVARRSNRQQNGFEKLVLVSPAHRLYRLRFHIWNPRSGGNNQEDEHNHSWEFASTVLSGCLNQQFFIESDSGEARFKHRFINQHLQPQPTPYQNGYVNAETLGQVRLKRVHEVNLASGSNYILTPEVIHRITNLSDVPSSTLFLHGPFQKSDSDVYTKIPLARDRLDIPSYKPEQLAQVIRNYLDSIGGSGVTKSLGLVQEANLQVDQLTDPVGNGH